MKTLGCNWSCCVIIAPVDTSHLVCWHISKKCCCWQFSPEAYMTPSSTMKANQQGGSFHFSGVLIGFLLHLGLACSQHKFLQGWMLSWSNNFVSGCKRHGGWGDSREIANVSLYWAGSPQGLTLELPASLLHSQKGNTRLFCTFSLKLHFPKKRRVGYIYLSLIMFFKCFPVKR